MKDAYLTAVATDEPTAADVETWLSEQYFIRLSPKRKKKFANRSLRHLVRVWLYKLARVLR